jgi:pimeloyl-ACP methyl ester carboxylesterase
LEAGLNDFSVQWALVQPDVSHFVRVCTYDRAGLGWSERSPHPRTRQVMAQELHTLLTNAGIQGPFVAVGHSFGGMVVRTFAQRYPDEVIGMVLVDAAHEAQLARIPALKNGAAALRQQFGLLAKLSALGLIALSPGQIPNRGLPDDALAHYRAVLATTGYFDAASVETTAFFNELEAAPDATPVPLGDLPLIVLSRGQAEPIAGQSAAESAQGEATWQLMQGELAGLSSNSQQRFAEQSGHYIQLQQPARVIDAIRQLVDASLGQPLH